MENIKAKIKAFLNNLDKFQMFLLLGISLLIVSIPFVGKSVSDYFATDQVDGTVIEYSYQKTYKIYKWTPRRVSSTTSRPNGCYWDDRSWEECWETCGDITDKSTCIEHCDTYYAYTIYDWVYFTTMQYTGIDNDTIKGNKYLKQFHNRKLYQIDSTITFRTVVQYKNHIEDMVVGKNKWLEYCEIGKKIPIEIRQRNNKPIKVLML